MAKHEKHLRSAPYVGAIKMVGYTHLDLKDHLSIQGYLQLHMYYCVPLVT